MANYFRRDGTACTEDEATDARGTIRDGYGCGRSLMLRDEGGRDATLTDAERLLDLSFRTAARMNAWRDDEPAKPHRTSTYQDTLDAAKLAADRLNDWRNA